MCVNRALSTHVYSNNSLRYSVAVLWIYLALDPSHISPDRACLCKIKIKYFIEEFLLKVSRTSLRNNEGIV